MALKIIQVGVGGFGKCWTPVILESREAKLAGFVDTNPKVLKEQAARHKVPGEICFTSLARAIDAVEADALINVTPPASHKKINFEAFEAGLHVLSEKPLADNSKDCTAIVKRARRKNVTFMVSQNYRFQNNIRTVKRLISSGRYGKPGYVVVDFFKGLRSSGFRKKMEYPLIIDMAIHHFDMMRYILGKEPISICARSWNPSWSWFKGDAASSVFIEMTDNLYIGYNASWVAVGNETPWSGNWRIECEKGVILLKDDAVLTQRGSGILKKVKPLKMSRQSQHYSLHEFVSSIKEEREPDSSGEDNLKSINMVFKTLESIKKGRSVRVNSREE